jgi:hypothetical protein
MTEVTIRRLDLAGRVIDLTTALTEASSITHGLIEIGQWLALEKINRHELQACFSKARGLVYANQCGQDFYNTIKNAVTTKHTWPFVIQQSGALGRIMVKDPQLAWIVSTTACLMQFHNNRFVSNVVCIMILKADPESRERPDYELNYLASRVELRSVINKIVDSIWFNVVNSGKGTEELPEQLKEVCRRGHHLNEDKFGVVTQALKEHRDKIVVETDHLLGNLTLWLMLHFHGTLTVSVSGKILYEKPSKDSVRIIELKVRRFCSKDKDCTTEENSIRLFSNIKGSFEQFLSGVSPGSFDMPDTSKTRKDLYDLSRAYDLPRAVLREQTRAAALQTAQLMVKWLMSIPLLAPDEFGDFSIPIKTLDFPEGEHAPFTISDIVGRSPSILNHQLGKSLAASMVYAPPQINENLSPGSHLDGSGLTSFTQYPRGLNGSAEYDPRANFTNEEILASFPILRDLVNQAKSECFCTDCRWSKRSTESSNSGNTAAFRVSPGCLSETALSLVLLSISHAIADSFGASDVSGVRNPSSILKGVSCIYYEVLELNQIRWDSWFNLAASVYLGCPFKEYVMDNVPTGIAYAAIQYGNLAVIASWLDMTAEHKMLRCFRFIPAEGKIGALRNVQGQQQFSGIMENFAIVQTEQTEDTSSYSQRLGKWTEPLTGSKNVGMDDSTFEEEVMLVSAADNMYRIFLRMRSDSSVRTVNPVDVMIRLAASIPVVECDHKDKQMQTALSKYDIKLYNFDDLLVKWNTVHRVKETEPPIQNRLRLTYHITSILECNGKINVARALTIGCDVVQNLGGCCLSCAIDKARIMLFSEEMDPTHINDLYIINIKPMSRQWPNSTSRILEGGQKVSGSIESRECGTDSSRLGSAVEGEVKP